MKRKIVKRLTLRLTQDEFDILLDYKDSTDHKTLTGAFKGLLKEIGEVIYDDKP